MTESSNNCQALKQLHVASMNTGAWYSYVYTAPECTLYFSILILAIEWLHYIVFYLNH